jgi:hypothetical protein
LAASPDVAADDALRRLSARVGFDAWGRVVLRLRHSQESGTRQDHSRQSGEPDVSRTRIGCEMTGAVLREVVDSRAEPCSATRSAAPNIRRHIVYNNLNIHLSEAVVRLVARHCGLKDKLGGTESGRSPWQTAGPRSAITDIVMPLGEW